MADVWIWRHPRPDGASGRCIGTTDLPVDPRKAKRLASRIRRVARRHGLPRRVQTSTLQRASDVGRWLRRWGWRHERHAVLGEIDFGGWEGLPWAEVPRAEVDAWAADFLHHRPGGGEALDALFDRAAAWRAAQRSTAIVVGHGGWMLAARWLASGEPRPTRAGEWPSAPAYDVGWCLPLPVGTAP